MSSLIARGTSPRLNQRTNHKTSESNDSSDIIRKVRSLDCVRRPATNAVNIRKEWIYPTSSGIQEIKASRFSSTAHRRRFHLSPTEESMHLSEKSDCSSSFSNLKDLDVEDASTSNLLSTSASTTSLSDLAIAEENIFSSLMTMFTYQRGQVSVRTFLKLTVFGLLFIATIADVAFRKKVLHNIEDPYILSSESSSPPQRYISSSDGPGHGSKVGGAGLGSAMIGSITDALSPILPFAGGVDLRRDENWGALRSWLEIFVHNKEDGPDMKSFANVLDTRSDNLVSITSIPRGGGQVNDSYGKATSLEQKGIQYNSEIALSKPEPFVPTSDIAELTLSDLALTFRYAIESGREGFDSVAFFSTADEGKPPADHVQTILKAMDDVANKSRGEGVLPALTMPMQDLEAAEGPISPSSGYGDVDALQFCAAMRLFAEWRILRQVPEGYKGYAVGMGLGHKDVVQNVAKIENPAHKWIEKKAEEVGMENALSLSERRKKDCVESKEETSEEITEQCFVEASFKDEDAVPRSPTLRQLMIHEIESDHHPTSKLPRLKEKSAAMGLLWVRRQLEYQTTTFSNVIKVPDVYPTTISAVCAAYSEVYGQFHGWAVQKIFNYSFQAAPDADVIFRHMNPRYLNSVRTAAENGDTFEEDGETRFLMAEKNNYNDETYTTEQEQLLGAEYQGNENFSNATSQILSGKIKKDENPLLRFGGHIASEWDKLGNHLGGEIDKLGRHIGGEWDKIGRHIGGEWDKLAANIGKIFNNEDSNGNNRKNLKKIHESNNESTDFRGGARQGSFDTFVEDISQKGLRGEALEKHISEEMEKKARFDILEYLKIAKPLLRDLAGLFAEMNMDDPTKV